jgi:hypothetical protein
MALHTSFASQSQARAHAIRTELAETKLCDLSITDYFNKMTGLADTLASIGQPLRSEDFTTYILNGLDEDYDNLVENINGRDTPLQPHELYSRLLGREQRVKARHASPSFSSANAAACGKPQKPSPTSGKPVGICPQINHMKLDEHTQRLLLSPSVRIARSKLFLFLLLFVFQCYNLLRLIVYIYTKDPKTHNRLKLLELVLDVLKPARTQVLILAGYEPRSKLS